MAGSSWRGQFPLSQSDSSLRESLFLLGRIDEVKVWRSELLPELRLLHF